MIKIVFILLLLAAAPALAQPDPVSDALHARLEAGEDIDYDGVSGKIEFDGNGDPTSASIGIYEYGDDNTSTPVDFIEGNV